MGAALPAEEHRASLLALCRVLLELREYPEAFLQARLLLGQSIEQGDPDAAAAACLAMYESGQEESISALGHAVWLVVACPVNPEQVLQAMRSLVEETPENSDGAAVAAMLGYFLVEKRSLGEIGSAMYFLPVSWLRKWQSGTGELRTRRPSGSGYRCTTWMTWICCWNA